MDTTTLVDATSAFDGIELGDRRLTKRLMNSVARIQARPRASFPQAFGHTAELEGFYRLVSNDRVGHDLLTEHLADDAHGRATSAEGCGAVIIAHDTTEYAFGRETSPTGLAQLSARRRGFHGHHAIALAETGPPRVHGMVGSHPHRVQDGVWTRVCDHGGIDLGVGSERWLNLFVDTHELFLDSGREVVHVMDREGDHFALMAEMATQRAQFVVRASHDRRADASGSRIGEILSGQPFEARREVRLSRRSAHKRPPKARSTHPVRDSRIATLSVRFEFVELQPPRLATWSGSGALGVTVIDVMETSPPEGQPPVHWRLLTNMPVSDVDEALRIVDIYRRRWLIEEFFKAIKSGCAFLKRQANSLEALLDVLAMLVPVAIATLNLRVTARSGHKAAWDDVLSELQLRILQHAQPKHRLTRRSSARQVYLAVAAWGGHLKSNGEPGWQTLGAGMEKLLAQEEGWRAAMAHMSKGG